MIFDHLSSIVDARDVLEARLFSKRNEPNLSMVEVVEWYQSWLTELERQFVNEILKEWLLKSDLDHGLTANGIICECKIKILREPLENFLKQLKTRRDKLSQLYCKSIRKTLKEIS